MLFVVFGHLVANGTPPGLEWYGTAKALVYAFHMPFFMYLSGFVFFLSGGHEQGDKRYLAAFGHRAERFLLPFLLFGVAIVLGKYALRHVLYVDDAPRSAEAGLSELFLHTEKSPALSIWYIYVLFVYCAITPLLWCLLRGSWIALGLLAFVLMWLPLTDDFYLDRVGGFFLFFVLGGVVATHRERVMVLFDRHLWVWLALFAVTLCGVFLFVPDSVERLLAGTASIPALHALVCRAPLDKSRALVWIGSFSFAIYLFNTIFIGLAKAIIVLAAPFEGLIALLGLPLLFAAGLFGPIALRETAVRRVPYLYRLTG